MRKTKWIPFSLSFIKIDAVVLFDGNPKSHSNQFSSDLFGSFKNNSQFVLSLVKLGDINYATIGILKRCSAHCFTRPHMYKYNNTYRYNHYKHVTHAQICVWIMWIMRFHLTTNQISNPLNSCLSFPILQLIKNWFIIYQMENYLSKWYPQASSREESEQQFSVEIFNQMTTLNGHFYTW